MLTRHVAAGRSGEPCCRAGRNAAYAVAQAKPVSMRLTALLGLSLKVLPNDAIASYRTNTPCDARTSCSAIPGRSITV